jgi:hypothetical protein
MVNSVLWRRSIMLIFLLHVLAWLGHEQGEHVKYVVEIT